MRSPKSSSAESRDCPRISSGIRLFSAAGPVAGQPSRRRSISARSGIRSAGLPRLGCSALAGGPLGALVRRQKVTTARLRFPLARACASLGQRAGPPPRQRALASQPRVSRVASASRPYPRSDDDGVLPGVRRGGATPEMACCRRNPKGWADWLRPAAWLSLKEAKPLRPPAALLVVGVALLRLRLLLAPCRAGNSAQRDHGRLRSQRLMRRSPPSRAEIPFGSGDASPVAEISPVSDGASG